MKSAPTGFMSQRVPQKNLTGWVEETTKETKLKMAKAREDAMTAAIAASRAKRQRQLANRQPAYANA